MVELIVGLLWATFAAVVVVMVLAGYGQRALRRDPGRARVRFDPKKVVLREGHPLFGLDPTPLGRAIVTAAPLFRQTYDVYTLPDGTFVFAQGPTYFFLTEFTDGTMLVSGFPHALDRGPLVVLPQGYAGLAAMKSAHEARYEGREVHPEGGSDRRLSAALRRFLLLYYGPFTPPLPDLPPSHELSVIGCHGTMGVAGLTYGDDERLHLVSEGTRVTVQGRVKHAGEVQAAFVGREAGALLVGSTWVALRGATDSIHSFLRSLPRTCFQPIRIADLRTGASLGLTVVGILTFIAIFAITMLVLVRVGVEGTPLLWAALAVVFAAYGIAYGLVRALSRRPSHTTVVGEDGVRRGSRFIAWRDVADLRMHVAGGIAHACDLRDENGRTRMRITLMIGPVAFGNALSIHLRRLHAAARPARTIEEAMQAGGRSTAGWTEALRQLGRAGYRDRIAAEAPRAILASPAYPAAHRMAAAIVHVASGGRPDPIADAQVGLTPGPLRAGFGALLVGDMDEAERHLAALTL